MCMVASTTVLRRGVGTATLHARQLTLPFLLRGYYRGYSFAVALSTFVVALALATGAFASVVCLLSSSIAALMTVTLIYRGLGGTFSVRADAVADWLFDFMVKRCVCEAVDVLLHGTRLQRILLISTVAIFGELGKLFSFPAMLTAASLLWMLCLVLPDAVWGRLGARYAVVENKLERIHINILCVSRPLEETTSSTVMMHSRNARHRDRGGHDERGGQPRRTYSRHHDDYTRMYGGGGRSEEEVVNYQKDRKRRRKAARVAAKEARVAAQERWAQERRAARAAVAAQRAARVERRTLREEQQQQRPRRLVRLSSHSASRDLLATAMTSRRKVGKKRRDMVSARDAASALADKKMNGRTPAAPITREATTGSDDDNVNIPHTTRKIAPMTSTASPTDIQGTTPARMRRAQSKASWVAVEMPAGLAERIRRSLNRLTMSNVVDLTHEVSGLFGAQAGATGEADDVVIVSRAAVVAGVVQELDRRCGLDTGGLTLTDTLPLAGLLRGLQLLHGVQVGAELVEGLCLRLQGHLRSARETAAENVTVVLAQLYLLFGTDATFTLSLLHYLLQLAARRTELDQAVDRCNEDAASDVALAAAACGLALLRACGPKLRGEAAVGLEEALRDARTRVTAGPAGMEGDEGTGRTLGACSVRFEVLVSAMSEIAAGHTRQARRSTTESDAPVEAMLMDLCAILPGATRGGARDAQYQPPSQQRRTLRRVVQTVHTLSGLTWQAVTAADKPARWYIPGVGPSTEDTARSSTADDLVSSGGRRAALAANVAERRSALSRKTARDAMDGTSSEDETDVRREQIRQLRREERAMAGQRLNTEHKREIFKCVANAADDLECFSLLMQRDPSFSRFADVCAVVLQCCYQELSYNTYYLRILERFCSARPACVKTLQFALWDQFKSIRIDAVDLASYLNLACLVTDLIEDGTFTLSLLRGLDLNETNKTIGLFTRMLVLRMLLQLSPARLTEVFFGGDGLRAHDIQTDTADFRRCLTKFVERYFVDELTAARWLPLFYDVVAHNTEFSGSGGMTLSPGKAEPNARLQLFMRRVHVAHKALKHGIS